MIPGMPVYEKENFRVIFEKSTIPMATVSPAAEILSVNPVFAQYLGYSAEELVGKSVYDITHPADVEQTRALYNDVSDGNRDHFCYEKRYYRKDGKIVWGLVTTTWLAVNGDNPELCIAIIQDISRHKSAESQLQQSEELYRSLVDNIDLGITLIDENHNILKINNTAARWFNENPGHFVDKKCFREFEKKDTPCPYCPGIRALKDGGPHLVETEGVRNDGTHFLVRIRAMPVPDPDGKTRKFIEVVEDLTYTKGLESKLKKKSDRLNYLAHHDQLTGLPNRTLLYDRLTQAVQRTSRTKEGLAIIVFALDHYRNINNILGHPVCVQVLKQAGKRVLTTLRKYDSLCMAGENDFALIVEKCNSSTLSTKIAQRILKSLNAKPFSVDGHELHISASAGISHFPGDGNDVETLLRAAEIARTRAHEQGGNAHQHYRPEIETLSKRRLLLENLLHKALVEDQLAVHFQPQVNPLSGKVIGMEALVRWEHPELGMVSPGEFIPLAEETGIIWALGRDVLLKACQQAKKWLEDSLLDFRIAVNISPRQMISGDFLKTVRECLKKADLSPEYLEIEVTENALIHDPDLAMSKLRAIRDMGIRIAIDDFGTGYSSLNYLKNLPIDRLKIAREFINNLPVVKTDLAIVRSILTLGLELGIDVIAEGVEKEDQLESLLSMGCTQIQGYYYSKPLLPPTATGYLKQGYNQGGPSVEIIT